MGRIEEAASSDHFYFDDIILLPTQIDSQSDQLTDVEHDRSVFQISLVKPNLSLLIHSNKHDIFLSMVVP